MQIGFYRAFEELQLPLSKRVPKPSGKESHLQGLPCLSPLTSLLLQIGCAPLAGLFRLPRSLFREVARKVRIPNKRERNCMPVIICIGCRSYFRIYRVLSSPQEAYREKCKAIQHCEFSTVRYWVQAVFCVHRPECNRHLSRHEKCRNGSP